MMITTDVKPRTGLNTSTGQRNVPRMAGGGPLPRKEISSYQGDGSLDGRLKELIKKAEEKEIYDKKTRENVTRFNAGESPEQSVGGTNAVVDSTIAKLRSANQSSMLDVNASVTQRGYQQNLVDNENRALQNKGGTYEATPAFQGSFWQQAAIADQAQAASLEAQRNNNRISAKTAADAAAQADNAYSQRYAAAQAADAQKFASTMQMFGQIAQPGNYKYWGG